MFLVGASESRVTFIITPHIKTDIFLINPTRSDTDPDVITVAAASNYSRTEMSAAAMATLLLYVTSQAEVLQQIWSLMKVRTC